MWTYQAEHTIQDEGRKVNFPFLLNHMEHKEFGTEPESHNAIDTRNFLTQTEQGDFGLVGIGYCSIQQDQQGFG